MNLLEQLYCARPRPTPPKPKPVPKAKQSYLNPGVPPGTSKRINCQAKYLAVIRKKGECTPEDVAKALGTNKRATSDYLRVLEQRGVVRRCGVRYESKTKPQLLWTLV